MSEELEGFALPPVRARSRDEAHCPAAGVAELRFEAVAVDRELGDGLDRRGIERRPQPLFERRSGRRGHAVHAQVPSTFLPTAYHDVAARAVAAVTCLRFGRDEAQVERRTELPADYQRKILDELAADCGGDLDVVGLDLPGVGRHGHRILHPSDGELRVHSDRAARRHLDVLECGRLKTGGGHDHHIPADGQLGNRVRALLRRRHRPFEIGGHVYGLDGSAGNDRSRLIGDLPGDRAAIRLRICRLAQGEEGGDRKDAGAPRTSTQHNRSFAFPAGPGCRSCCRVFRAGFEGQFIASSSIARVLAAISWVLRGCAVKQESLMCRCGRRIARPDQPPLKLRRSAEALAKAEGRAYVAQPHHVSPGARWAFATSGLISIPYPGLS